jgi:hypothetical protein
MMLHDQFLKSLPDKQTDKREIISVWLKPKHSKRVKRNERRKASWLGHTVGSHREQIWRREGDKGEGANWVGL